MSTATQHLPMASDELMSAVHTAFLQREHRLSPRMLASGRLTEASAQAALHHLEGRPLKQPVPAGFRPEDARSEPRVPVRPHDDPSHGRDVAQAMADVSQASPEIPRLASFTDIPAGYYAVPSRTGNNDLDFFWVDRPDKGNWEGHTFVKRVIGGQPDARIQAMQARIALLAIRNHGHEAAALLYATQIGRCSKCNRHLTDETSRAIGKGPTCRGD